MKYASLIFSYNNFDASRKLLDEYGYYTVNIGDYMQTIAAQNIYRKIGVSEEDMIFLDRDSMADYKGEKTFLLMNGCFYNHCFPIPDSITPIFVGFQAQRHVIETHLETLKKYAPIGCRDVHTCEILKSLGVDATVTGCITLALDKRDTAPQKGKTYFVYGSGAGYLPPEMFKEVPEEKLLNGEILFHRKVVHNHPLPHQEMMETLRYTEEVLKIYEKNASLIVTPLHHVATPCMSMGIPVVVCRKKNDTRFSFIETLLPIHERGDYKKVDWNPEAFDNTQFTADMLKHVKQRIEPVKKSKRGWLSRLNIPAFR
jgi:hypothetical protein